MPTASSPIRLTMIIIIKNCIFYFLEVPKLGVDHSQHNYALQLNSGDSIIHNRFVVPDWGVLRLDLHTPNLSNGAVIVSIQSDEPGYQNYILNTITLTSASGGASISDPMGQYLSDRYKIGYGTQGFETFHFDLPPALRGKVATLKIEVNGGTVYLDDVFFQSKDLWFGNPTLNGQKAGTDIINNVNNYLIEKPQYSLSYNSSKKEPNWVSYELDQTWLGNATRKTWIQDPELPLTQADPPDIVAAGYDTGHLVANAHRQRNNKDVRATFLSTNAVAQNYDNNSLFLGETPKAPAWTDFEGYLTSLVQNSSRQLYIIAGGYGSNSEVERRNRYSQPDNPDDLTKPTVLTDKGVTIPGWTWRIALVLDQAGESPNDVTANAEIYAILTPNIPEPENEAPRTPDGKPNNQSDFVSPVAHPFYTLPGFTGSIPINTISNKAEWRNWQNWRVTIDDIEALTGLDFFTNIPKDIRDILKGTLSPVITPSASLLAATSEPDDSIRFTSNSAIGQDGVIKNSVFGIKSPGSTSQISISQVSTSEICSTENGTSKIGTLQVSSFQAGTVQLSSLQAGISQIGKFHNGIEQVGTTKVGVTQIGVSKLDPVIVDNTTLKGSLSEINLTQVSPTQIEPAKIALSSNITLQQLFNLHTGQEFLSIHTLTPESITTINSTAQNLWNTLLAPTTPFNINLQLTDSLAKGQLAEAIVTKYDDRGRPIGGTIEVDPTANGLGWFIDPTITDTTEFSQTLSDTASRATTNSDAYGHYDLLTALLHEMAHLAGFIWGNSGFDSHVQIVNGSRLFVGDNFTAPLTPDGSHLDPKTYAYDLLNPTLTPGLRELPSQIDVEILKEVRDNSGVIENIPTQAALTSSPLTDILNGKFDISYTTDPNYGWTTRGAATVLSNEAVLTEDSPLNSEFKQTFTVPQGAKYLEFTLKDTTLGSDSANSPGDAFEVALLDANEKTSLVDTANGLTRSDALLNSNYKQPNQR